MAIKCGKCEHRNVSGCAGLCNYIGDTGHCKIVTAVREDGTEYKTVSPVEDCAFFEPKKGGRKVTMTLVQIRKIDYDLVRKLYLQGLVDREIAEKVGCAKDTVWKWRKQHKLPSNRYKKAY